MFLSYPSPALTKVGRRHLFRVRNKNNLRMSGYNMHHPMLYTLMALTSMAELGLTAFLINQGDEQRTWPSRQYHTLLIVFLTASCWTSLFASAYVLWVIDNQRHLLANIASSLLWLIMTSILWGITAGFMHFTRTGGDCAGLPVLSRCRQSLTVEALGWGELGVCLTTLIVTICWLRETGMRENRVRKRWSLASVVDSRRMV